jgi:ankyrin repeat protein
MLEELMEAARMGDAETIRAMLQSNPELVQATLPSGESPLVAALYYGRQAAVEALLNCGVSVTIHEAAMLGDVETIAYMLDLESKLISEFSFDGWTPLHLACFFGGYEAVELLIARGGDVNARSTNGMSNMPIHAATAGNRTAIVQLLLDKGADPNVKQSGGWTPVQQSVDHFDKSTTVLLLTFGADPNIAQDSGKTAFTIAEEKGFTEMLEILNQLKPE